MRAIFDVLRDGLASINAASEQMAAARQQVSSGKRVSGPSGDPLGVQQAINEHAAIGALDAYTQSGNSASARLAAADTVLSGIVDKLTSAIVSAQSARGSTATAATRTAAAQELLGLGQSLLGDINFTFNGTQVFSGSRIDVPAYVKNLSGWTYQGDAAPVRVEVERGRQVAVSFDGQSIAQGGDPQDLFTVLDDLVTAVQSGNSAGITSGVDALEHAFDRAVQAQSRLGADERGVDDAAARVSALRLAAEARRSKLEDVNMADALTRMNLADTSYRAALGAVSTAERVSLLDYLR